MHRGKPAKSSRFSAPARLWGGLLAMLLAGLTVSAQEADRASLQAEFFEKQIRPLLVAHCVDCHGPEAQEAGLRLDSRANLLKGSDNGPVIMPGKPDDSLLVRAIRYEGDLQMPPSEKLKPLRCFFCSS